MSNAAKILAGMRNNPRDWRLKDLQVLADLYRIDYDRSGTSHVTFRHPSAGRVTVPARRPIKPVYVRKFIQLIDSLENSDET